jgi:hypothetical protein
MHVSSNLFSSELCCSVQLKTAGEGVFLNTNRANAQTLKNMTEPQCSLKYQAVAAESVNTQSFERNAAAGMKKSGHAWAGISGSVESAGR